MTTYTTKTLAVAMADMHKDQPFADREKAVLWAYDQHDDITLNMADKAYKLSGISFQKGVKGQKEKGMAWLDEHYPTVWSWTTESVQTAVTDLVTKFGVKPNTAKEWCREHSDILGMQHPIAALDSDEVIQWIVDNYAKYDDYEELKAAIIEHWTAQGRSRSNINEYTKGLRMHYAILAAHH